MSSKKNKIFVFIFVLALILLSSFALPIALLCFLGLLPTLVSSMIDFEKQHYLTYTLGCFNLCGVIPYLEKLCRPKPSFEIVWSLLSSPFSWLMMYGMAALGLGVYFMIPKIVAVIRKNILEAELKTLEKYKQDLIEEWGEKVLPPLEGIEEG
jgi:phosphate/sulfate permease